MKLSKRLRKWKANLTTQTPVEYILTLRADVNGFADEVKALERENAKLREELEAVGIAAYLYGRDDIRAENDKLRELCADMYEWMGRAMYDGSARKYEYELIVSRMHDLGIEAD